MLKSYCMDLLTDILQQAGLKKRILIQKSFFEPIAVQFPCSKSMGFHFVISGEAFLHTPTQSEPIILHKGDIALIARGYDHIISTEKRISARLIKNSDSDTGNLTNKNVNLEHLKLTLISGAYQFWNTPMHPFFKDVPKIWLLRSSELENFNQLNLSINLLSKEFTNPEVGSDLIIQNMLDILFSLIMRKIISQKSTQQKSWSYAVNDFQIKKSIELLHGDLKQNWSLDDLAKKVGMSRAGFALKFKKSLGDTPLHYLSSIRIQKAIQHLINTDDKIDSIAESVGFNDAFTFSKVFKRIVGISPREFRINDRADKKLETRF